MSNRPPLRDRSALPWELRRRGLKDSLRHDQRVKEAIRKQLRELIADAWRVAAPKRLSALK